MPVTLPAVGSYNWGDVLTTAVQGLSQTVDNRTVYDVLSTAHPPHREGRIIYETDTDRILVSDGAAWLLVWAKTPTVGSKQYAYTAVTINSPINSTAFSNLAGFTFAAVAGGTYAVEAVLFLNSASSSPKAKFGWSWTGTGAMTAGQVGLDTSVVSPNYTGPNTAHAISNDVASPLDPSTGFGVPAGIATVARLYATYVCTASGTVQLRFAQFASDANALQVTHGSRMTTERIA